MINVGRIANSGTLGNVWMGMLHDNSRPFGRPCGRYFILVGVDPRGVSEATFHAPSFLFYDTPTSDAPKRRYQRKTDESRVWMMKVKSQILSQNSRVKYL